VLGKKKKGEQKKEKEKKKKKKKSPDQGLHSVGLADVKWHQNTQD